MAKKKKLQSQAPVLTRGQLSRAAREQRRIRNLYTGAAIVGALVVLVLGYALINTYVIRPNVVVAKVGDVNITRETYNKLRRYNVYTSLNSSASYEAQTGQSATTLGLPAVSDLQAQLVAVNNEQTLDATTVNQLVDNEVLRQKSGELGVNPTHDELVAAQVSDFVPSPTPLPTTPTVEPATTPSVGITGTATLTSTTPVATSTPTLTPTAGSPTATPSATSTLPPVAGAQQTAQSIYNSFVKGMSQSTSPSNNVFCQYGCPNISEDDLLRLVLDPRVRKQQATDKLGATQVMTEVEQINVQRVVTDTKAAAETIKARLDHGDDFAKVANEMSSEQPANGGNIGWISKEGSSTVTDAAFSAKALDLKQKVGQVSDPVQVGDKWYIIKTLEHADKRAREQSQIDTLKSKAYDDWFAKAKASYGNNITTPGLPVLPSIPTAPAVTEPTTAPVQQTPQGPVGPPAASSPGTITGTVGITATTAPAGTTPVQTTPQASPTQNIEVMNTPTGVKP